MNDHCRKCGVRFNPGDLRYLVRIQTSSMWDGYVEEPDGDVDEEIERLIQVLSREDPKKMVRDVAHTLEVVLCPTCRHRLLKEYDAPPAGPVH